jgi:predicted DNA-binding protein (MmcQ/YjbR family)
MPHSAKTKTVIAAQSEKTSARFRTLALSLPEVEEKSHFGKPDFRVKNKIFAGFNAEGRAYVKLRPEQQDMLTSA